MFIAVKSRYKSSEVALNRYLKNLETSKIICNYLNSYQVNMITHNPKQTSTTANIYSHAIKTADEMAADVLEDILTPAINTRTRTAG
jgi:hypothetical protein